MKEKTIKRSKNRLQVKKEQADRILEENLKLRKELGELNQRIKEVIKHLDLYEKENEKLRELLREQEEVLQIQFYKYYAIHHPKYSNNDKNRTN